MAGGSLVGADGIAAVGAPPAAAGSPAMAGGPRPESSGHTAADAPARPAECVRRVVDGAPAARRRKVLVLAALTVLVAASFMFLPIRTRR